MKHENAYPLTGLPFDLSSSQTRSSLFGKQNYVKKQEIGKRYFCEFSMARQAWFSTENSSLYCASELVFTTKLPFFLVFIYFILFLFSFYFYFFYLLAVSDQLRSR